MVKHKVYVKRQRQGLGERNLTSLCRRAVKATLYYEGIETPCEVSVLATDDKGIQEINKEHRALDRPTDVLSFPTYEFKPGKFEVSENMIEEGEYVHLGDIVISVDRASEQANEYGHNPMRELAYLTVHATLHLLGYEHEIDEDKHEMRRKEESVLNELGLRR